MLKERLEAAHQVSDRLLAAEQAIDAAISAAAELSAVMPTARYNARLSAVIGQDAMTSAAKSLLTLIEARNQIVETHGMLDDVKNQIGLRERAVGGGMLKPGAPLLQAVDSAAA
jgi:fumarate hydratase class II